MGGWVRWVGDVSVGGCCSSGSLLRWAAGALTGIPGGRQRHVSGASGRQPCAPAVLKAYAGVDILDCQSGATPAAFPPTIGIAWCRLLPRRLHSVRRSWRRVRRRAWRPATWTRCSPIPSSWWVKHGHPSPLVVCDQGCCGKVVEACCVDEVRADPKSLKLQHPAWPPPLTADRRVAGGA